MILTILAIGTIRLHTYFTPQFRVDPTGPPNYVAEVSSPNSLGEFSKGNLRIDLIEMRGGSGKRLVSSTDTGDPVALWKASLHFLGTPKTRFPTPLLAMEVNGGQHDHLMIWWFDPLTMRPKKMLDVLYGDIARLDRGIVVENTPSQYVAREDWPRGTIRLGDYLHRTWQFETKSFRFVSRKWRN